MSESPGLQANHSKHAADPQPISAPDSEVATPVSLSEYHAIPAVLRSQTVATAPLRQAALLRLQRTQGNRATRRTLQRLPTPAAPVPVQRKAAAELFAHLPDLGGNRWHSDMQGLIDDLERDHATLDIGKYKIGVKKKLTIVLNPAPSQLLQQFSYAVSMATNNPEFFKTRHYKVVQYLLTGRGTLPGMGSLGKIRIVGNKIKGRPGFSSRTLKGVIIKPGQARRHITAWHNIRAFANKLIKKHPELLKSALQEAIKKKTVDNAMLKEVQSLLAKKPASLFGDLGQDDGKKVVTAAFLMNSRMRNLWAGAGRENSEIATVSSNFQKYIADYKSTRDITKLKAKISGYNTQTPLAQTTQQTMLTEINTNFLKYKGTSTAKHTQLATTLIGHIKPMEVDLPQGTAAPTGGGLGVVEHQHHTHIFQFVFEDKDLPQKTLKNITHYFLSGSDTPQ